MYEQYALEMSLTSDYMVKIFILGSWARFVERLIDGCNVSESPEVQGKIREFLRQCATVADFTLLVNPVSVLAVIASAMKRSRNLLASLEA